MTLPQPAFAPPLDLVTFSLTEESTFVRDTVRIVVQVHALKGADVTGEAMRREMEAAVRRFVGAPDWQLSQPRRETQATGNETVTLTASVRVPETENHDLKERADKVSRPGLTLSNPVVEATMPTDLLQRAEGALRRALLRRAMDEAEALSVVCPSWVVHLVDFGALSERERVPPGQPGGQPGAITRSAVLPAPAPAGAPSPRAAGDGLSANASRVFMTASVTLRRTD